MAIPSSSMFFMRFLFPNCLVFLLLLCVLKEGNALGAENHLDLPLSSLLPASVCSTPFTKGEKRGASLQVLHRHGPCSQFNHDKANVPTRTQILSSDRSRVNSIHSRLAFESGQPDLENQKQAKVPAKRGASLGSGNYIVTVGLGTPKRDLSLIFDTGSDLSWTQCKPCVRRCYKQQDPTFDPSKSTTYSNITCKAPQCSELGSATGNLPGCSASTCIYGIQYGDQSFSVGYFGKERLSLSPTDVFDGFFFGCGQNNQGLFGRTAGLLGLGRHRLSIVSQTAQKYGKYFSYCLPTQSSSAGHLSFGNGGVPPGVRFTPFGNSTRGSSFYFIDITAISVGGRTLSIPPSIFKTAGTIIDSGTVISRLPATAYSALRSAFRQQMTKYPSAPGVSILDTCYDLSRFKTVSIPKIGYFFNGGVNVDVAPTGILYGVSASQVCLAFAGNSGDTDVGIFGNVQQQTLEVVYDVAGGKLGFGPGGCA